MPTSNCIYKPCPRCGRDIMIDINITDFICKRCQEVQDMIPAQQSRPCQRCGRQFQTTDISAIDCLRCSLELQNKNQK